MKRSFKTRTMAIVMIALLVFVFKTSFASSFEYTGKASIDLQEAPSFEGLEMRGIFIEYGQLDELKRATGCVAKLGSELIAGERQQMTQLQPTGWRSDAYDFIEGKNLYNRCHLVGHQFAGAEGLDNIVTGTRYLNISGMLPYENKVADYMQKTGNHVYYRATPVYSDQNLVCDGIKLEAKSIEDDELQFSVYCFNVQPGVIIDYRTGIIKTNVCCRYRSVVRRPNITGISPGMPSYW